MPRSRSPYRTAPNLPPQIAKDIERAIAIVMQVREELTKQTERLDQLEGELRLLVDGPDTLIAPLTPRELEMLRYAATGETNKEIAARLGIELSTVKNHVHNVLDKLGARRRTEAVARMRPRSLDPAGNR